MNEPQFVNRNMLNNATGIHLRSVSTLFGSVGYLLLMFGLVFDFCNCLFMS